MKKALSVLTGMVFTGCILSAPLTAQSAAEDDTALWEKFLRYDLCITDYDALTPEEQELCHFIYDTEQGTKEAIRCERARRTLAHDPYLGERVTVEQAENSYGIGDRLSSRYLQCVPDIAYLDAYFEGYYYDCWLDDTGTDYLHICDDIMNNRHKIVHIRDGVQVEEITHKQLPVLTFDYTGDRPYLFHIDISGYSDYVFENGDCYAFLPDGNAALVLSRYARAQYDENAVTEPVVVPDSVQGHPVTVIEPYAFHHANVKEIQLPNTMQYIYSGAFTLCSVKTINFPKNLKMLGGGAFQFSGLEEISIDSPELDIFGGAFQYCHFLKTADLNVHSVGASAFANCRSLQTVTLGSALERIYENAFSESKAIKTLVLPDSVRIIGTGAFTGISSVTVPESVEIIGALPAVQGDNHIASIPTPPRTHPLTDEPECVFSDNAIIYGETGSSAEEYANEWGLTFIPLGVQAGTPAGVKLLACWLAGMPGAEITDPEAYDLNGDDILNAVDLSLLKQSIA